MKPHIGILGRRNVGKSTFINALTGQETAIVSEVAGTTTDPVRKSIEISGIGPVVLIDTAGIDDTGELGEKRVKKTHQVLDRIDMGIILLSENTFGDEETRLIKMLNQFDVPFFFVHNKEDISSLSVELKERLEKQFHTVILPFSAKENPDIVTIAAQIFKQLPPSAYQNKGLIFDLVSQGDIVLLITPIDIEAPEGRLILPQVQVIRDVLDNDCVAIVLKEKEAMQFLNSTKIRPKLVITDSSIFLKADAMIPQDIPLTGFSVLLARYKGPFEKYLEGTPKLAELRDGDKVLILESCTHHVTCDDIGRVKIPRWLSSFSGRKLEFVIVSGLDTIPGKPTDYAIVVQCGGCMITRKQVTSRLKPFIDANVSVTNYGLAIAYVQGIYNRAISPFVKSEKVDYL